MQLGVSEVLAVKTVTLNLLDNYAIKSKEFFDSVIIIDEVPISEISPCILTEILNSKGDELNTFWSDKRMIN